MEVGHLSPHISQSLNSNQWLFDVSGVLQHCVAVLKLCHALTDQLAKIPLQDINPQLNEIICEATTRLVPRFDNLLGALSLPKVDVRLIEARASALTTACWSLVVPFYILNPKYKEVFGKLVQEMEAHAQQLSIAAEQLERRNPNENEEPDAEPDDSNEQAPQTSEEQTEEPNMSRTVENRKPEATPTVKETLLSKSEEISQRRQLLTDETAPADPASS